jgi:hypothetical protein
MDDWSVTTQEDKVIEEGIYDAVVERLSKVETLYGEGALEL